MPVSLPLGLVAQSTAHCPVLAVHCTTSASARPAERAGPLFVAKNQCLVISLLAQYLLELSKK